MPRQITAEVAEKMTAAIDEQRLLDTAVELVGIPSPTRSAGAVADRLAEILTAEGFAVERPEAGWPDAPAVAARLDSGRPGKVLQYNGHLDTVHLPFVPPRVENGMFYGSGSSDMKGGVAAAVEAMRALRDTQALDSGGVLLTAHDLHETPWGDGSQVNALIAAGYVGDGVLLPEYLSSPLPVIGRGLAVLGIDITRAGEPVHEVLGGIDQPSVIRAGADLVLRMHELDQQLAGITHPQAGRESMFVGQIEAGEIFNQAPKTLTLAGTRRWLPQSRAADVETQYRELLDQVAAAHGVEVTGRFQIARDAYSIAADDPLVEAMQAAHFSVSGAALPIGAKPFVDDGNAFVQQAGIPAITHGPDARGAHTLNEEVAVAELVRVARIYALTAAGFC